VRLYLPATLPRLAYWLSEGEATLIDYGPGELAFGVTPTLREWYHEADLDELEHAAAVDASVGSLELLAEDPLAPKRRVVVAVDVDDGLATPVPARGRAALTLAGPVPVNQWASALVDDATADLVVATAIASLAGAARGDDDAQFALDEAQAHELGWYAVQELHYLTD
jgi:hypothetical protein